MLHNSQSENEIEILSEELEILKHELDNERQLTKAYYQEVKLLEDELSATNRELCAALMAQKLELDDAKELAKSIAKNNNSLRESLAKLISAIYGSPVKPDQVGGIYKSRSTISHLINDECDRIVAKSIELKEQSALLKTNCKELGARFVEFKAHYLKLMTRLQSDK